MGILRMTRQCPKKERMPDEMDCTLQKAGIWKRIAAYLLDLILLAILATGAMAGLSAILRYDEKSDRVTEFYYEYGQRYGIDLHITEQAYEQLSAEERALYEQATIAMNSDEEMIYAYQLLFNSSLVIASLGILLAYLVLEFLIPLFLAFLFLQGY